MSLPWTCSALALFAGLLANTPAIAGNHTPPIHTPAETARAAADKAWRADVAADKAWRAHVVDTLAAMPDADALVTAATLARLAPGDGARTMDLLDRAIAAAPQAADIGLLSVILCNQEPGCDVLKREARVRAIDPANGDTWMATLHDASVLADQRSIDEVLDQMARTTRFDLYYHRLGRRFMAALNRLPPPLGSPADTDEARRQMQAMALVVAFVLPPLQDLTHACKPGTPASDARDKVCRDIATSMERGDSLIANMVGLRLHEWAARDASDRAQALEQQRRLRWKMHQLSLIAGTNALPPAKHIAGMLAHDNEVESIDAMLADAHLPLDPPADWRPPRPLGTRNASSR